MRICFFGDSFTNGTGDDECLGWVGRICAAERRLGHDLTCYNLGVRRDTSEDILRRWRREAEARLPKGCDPHFVFAFGNNDVALDDDGQLRLSHSVSCKNAKEILVDAKGLGPTLVLGPVPSDRPSSWNERILSLSTNLSSVCAGLDIPFLNLAELKNDFWSTWHAEAAAGDGAHPNAAAYAQLASHISQWSPWRSWFDR